MKLSRGVSFRKNSVLFAAVALFLGAGSLAHRARAESPSTTASEATPFLGSCYRADAFTCEVELEVARITNFYRQQSGMSPLAFDEHMSFVARVWSKYQADRGQIGHDGFPDHRQQVYLNEFGSMEGLAISGENVAMNYWGYGQTASVVASQLTNQWWNSPDHQANMLGSFHGLGVGVTRRENGAVYGTQIFYLGHR